MESGQVIKMVFEIIGGLGVFMLGMKYMSDGLQAIAGDRLRQLIGAVTNNRILAVFIGTAVTCIIQSSSVTTVMVVGFVNSGFMTLGQAIGVVMGANIGTTITGWILVLKIGKYGLPMLGVAALVYRFARNERWHFIALAVMGVGMIFFGLELMKNGFKPLSASGDFSTWFHAFRATDYPGVLKCAAVGCILTCIVQSSSATLGITIGLACTGVIPYETAAALVLGENIGTTITAFLASIGTTTNAKRAAYAHVVFNVLGVLWITAIFSYYIRGVIWFIGQDPNTPTDSGEINATIMTAAIAATHTGFNIANVIIFLPFTRKLAALLERVIPDKPFKEAPHLTRLDTRLIETPTLGIEQSRIELVRMGESVKKMMEKLRRILAEGPAASNLVKKVFHREEVLDIMQKEVVVFLTDLLADNASHEIANEGRRQLRMADELESVGDYIAAILKLHLRLEQEGLTFSEPERKGLLALHDSIYSYIEMIERGYQERHPDVISKARTRGDEITHQFRELREQHLTRISDSRMEPLESVNYTNALNAYRRVKDHMFNFAEAMAGAK